MLIECVHEKRLNKRTTVFRIMLERKKGDLFLRLPRNCHDENSSQSGMKPRSQQVMGFGVSVG